ncbi:MAG: tRNA lysidine(34) synthetase TilS [Pseudomonadota bacterium]
MEFGADFDALIQRFSPDSTAPIAIAVSGGRDSTALMHLTADRAKQLKRDVLVLTLDHRLRPEAAAEAMFVAKQAAHLGLAHKTLVWGTPRPSQAAARTARHTALAEAAQAAGASVLLMGHTRDDCIETALMRKRRQQKPVDLIGPWMAAPSPVWPQGRGVTVLRPLIHTPRGALTQFLRRRRVAWIDDPSNLKHSAERVRVRRVLARSKALGVSIAPRLARLERAAYDQRLHRAERLMDPAFVTIEASGLIQVSDAALDGRDGAVVLQDLLRLASGRASGPSVGRLKAFLGEDRTTGSRETLGGAWLQRGAGGWQIGRDPRHPAMQLGTIWDGRYAKHQHHTPGDQDALKNARPPAPLPFLLRKSGPPEGPWREIISERLSHLIRIYQTPLLTPVQR